MRGVLFTLVLLLAPMSLAAGDNELSAKEKSDGWKLLFNGRDLSGWKCNNGKKISTPVEDGSLVPFKSGGYLIVYDKPFGDFEFKCDVKMGEKCNSGIFFRVGDLKRPVQSGFEVQVLTGKGTGYHDFGSIYDLVKPKKNRAKKPGEWNTVTIRCQGPSIRVSVNGAEVARMNCDKWTVPGRRLDGTRHKFAAAVKDFPRVGHIGLQDHGHKVWYRNIKIRELK